MHGKNYQKHGNFSLDTLLTPAIDLANNGFSVSEVMQIIGKSKKNY